MAFDKKYKEGWRIKKISCLTLALLLTPFLCGCNKVGDKSASVSLVYAVTMVLSLAVLLIYLSVIQRKEIWLLLLFSSVTVVNCGYFALSVSKSLDVALWANRVSYLGSVFLPFAMLMIILKVIGVRCGKSAVAALVGVACAVFLVAASPGYLDIYYKEVSLEFVNGVSVLDKAYGSWHKVYLFYLLGYFSAMVYFIVNAAVRKKIRSSLHGLMLGLAVFVNLGVWLLEQCVKLDFEFLSVSYVICEFFLVSLYLLINQERERELVGLEDEKAVEVPMTLEKSLNLPLPDTENEFDEARTSLFVSGLSELTKTEKAVYDLYTEGKTTKDVLAALNIKENTLKYHNKNLYSKLGVSSRKQLLKIAAAINHQNQT